MRHKRTQHVVGRLEVIRSGDGFVIPEETGLKDIFVPHRALRSAVEGDRVEVEVLRRRRGRNPEGRLVGVLERAVSQVVGIYHSGRRDGIVIAQEPELPTPVSIPAEETGGAADGALVLVRIREWGDEALEPAGSVERVLGRPDEPGIDVLAILLGHGLPDEFSREVLEEADRIARRGIREEDLSRREDLRHLNVLTIDPEDARDHDDALSVRKLEDGRIELGVHIADVSFYVKRGSALDREAQRRGTSVYLVDRVVPMLPEQLSAHLCSLVENEDRLALSLLMQLDARGRVLEHRLTRSVIRVRNRLSYEQAQRGLDDARSGKGDLEAIEADLLTLSRLARTLRRLREAGGAIDFALPETAVRLDDQGRAVACFPRPRLETHRLVEQCMILANETVARSGRNGGLLLLYRIHEEPDEDKIEELREVAAAVGYKLQPGRVRPGDLAALVRSVAGTPHEYFISTLTLRSMKRARYSTHNVGHFGLASRAYVHFTSPIRRYPDLLVHRAVVRRLRGPGRSGEERQALEEIGRHASDRERRAEAAERDSVELRMIEYMRRHLGEEFRGTISGVQRFGMFVLLDGCPVEGLVHVDAIGGDRYRFDGVGHSLSGTRTRRRFRLGDRVVVRLLGVDPETRHVDLSLVGRPLDRDGIES